MKIATDIRKIAPDTVSASLPSYGTFPGMNVVKEAQPFPALQQLKPQQLNPKKPVFGTKE